MAHGIDTMCLTVRRVAFRSIVLAQEICKLGHGIPLNQILAVFLRYVGEVFNDLGVLS